VKDNIEICLVTRLFQRVPQKRRYFFQITHHRHQQFPFNYSAFARPFLAVTSSLLSFLLNSKWATQKLMICTGCIIHIGSSGLSADFLVSFSTKSKHSYIVITEPFSRKQLSVWPICILFWNLRKPAAKPSSINVRKCVET